MIQNCVRINFNLNAIKLTAKRRFLFISNRKSSGFGLEHIHGSFDKAQYLFHASRLVSKNKAEIEKLRTDPRFVNVCDEIVDEMRNEKRYSLSTRISMLRSVLFLGLDPNTKVVEYLENELLFESRHLDGERSVKCLAFHHLYRETDLQKRVVKALVSQIEEKFDQIASNKDLLLECWKFYSLDLLGPELLRKIEIATLLLLDKTLIEPKILLNMIVALSATKKRSISLLHKISEMITSNSLTNIKDPDLLISTISALNSLNFCDTKFLNCLSNALCSNDFQKVVKPTTISILLKSIGQLNWKCTSLIDLIHEHMKDPDCNFRCQEYISFILTLAKLNYRPKNLQDTLEQRIFPKVTPEIVNNNLIWLDFVWSLAILNELTSNHLKSVFNSSFIQNVLEVNPIEQTFVKMKLLNIKAVANLEMNTIFEVLQDIEDYVKPVRSNALNVLNNAVINDLNTFIPCSKYMLTDVKSPIGTIINAQFAVNKDLKPLHISRFVGKITINSLPKGFKRCSVLVFGFRDKILDSTELTGVNQMTIRLLKKLGDCVIVIDQNNYDTSSTAIQRIQSLRERIKSSVNNELKHNLRD